MSRLDIAIAGEINLDLVLYGLPEQMPLERELLASGFAITLGSSSAILAHNLAALGSRVGFVTKVGDVACGVSYYGTGGGGDTCPANQCRCENRTCSANCCR